MKKNWPMILVAVSSSAVSSMMTIMMAASMIGKEKDWISIGVGVVLEAGKFVLLSQNFSNSSDKILAKFSNSLAYGLVALSIGASMIHVYGTHALTDEIAGIERSKNESLKNQALSVERQIEILMDEYDSSVEKNASSKKTKEIAERAQNLREEHLAIIKNISSLPPKPKNQIQPIVMVLMAVCMELLSLVSIRILHAQPQTEEEESEPDFKSYTASMIAEDIALGRTESKYKEITQKYGCGTKKAKSAMDEAYVISKKMRKL